MKFSNPICSCVAAIKNGRVEICPNELGNRITPSWVSWDSNGLRLIGEAAKKQACTNPMNTVYDIKRFIGRKWTDETVQQDIKALPFRGAVAIDIIYHTTINKSLLAHGDSRKRQE